VSPTCQCQRVCTSGASVPLIMVGLSHVQLLIIFFDQPYNEQAAADKLRADREKEAMNVRTGIHCF
jgi:hypothetical protein